MAGEFPKTRYTWIHPVHVHISRYRDDRRGRGGGGGGIRGGGKKGRRGWLVQHSASSRFAVFFLGLSKRRIAYSCIDLFRLFALFLLGVQGGFFVCDGFSRKKRRAEGEDSGHCGTIRTKVAIATEFKGAEEWRPMQIEGFFSYVATVATGFSRIIDTASNEIRLHVDENVNRILVITSLISHLSFSSSILYNCHCSWGKKF